MSFANQVKTYVNRLCRFPWSQPTAHRCPKASRITFDGRRLPSKCHDLCQLLEASRLLLQGSYEAEVASGYVGRNGEFPPFLTSTDAPLSSLLLILRTSISELPYICTHPHCSLHSVKRYFSHISNCPSDSRLDVLEQRVHPNRAGLCSGHWQAEGITAEIDEGASATTPSNAYRLCYAPQQNLKVRSRQLTRPIR